MTLKNDIHLIDTWNWKIEKVSHEELLWKAKQIIRLQENFYNRSKIILNDNLSLNLFNQYNPKNIDLIRNYKENKEENNKAVIAKILKSTEEWPILDFKSFKKVEVSEMDNIFFENITDKQIMKSFFELWSKASIHNLINILSKDFYKWDKTPEEIIKYQKLFFRQIKN